MPAVVWKPSELTRDEGKAVERAWQSVLAGQGLDAEKRFRELLRKHPGSVPAETGLGYALLRQERPGDAARSFASVLGRNADYVPLIKRLVEQKPQRECDEQSAAAGKRIS